MSYTQTENNDMAPEQKYLLIYCVLEIFIIFETFKFFGILKFAAQ